MLDFCYVDRRVESKGKQHGENSKSLFLSFGFQYEQREGKIEEKEGIRSFSKLLLKSGRAVTNIFQQYLDSI